MSWALSSLGHSGLHKFLILCWQIWKARNELVYNHLVIPPPLCVGHAWDWLSEYQQAMTLDFSPSHNNRVDSRWSLPPMG